MHNAYATDVQPLKSCTLLSFFKLIDQIWKGEECPNYPLHRFLTLMRKMNARSYVREELKPNNELLEEKEMATKRCGGEVEIEQASRLTFFDAPVSTNSWQDLGEEHLLGYAVIVTLKLPNNSFRTYMLESVTQPPGISFSLPEEHEGSIILKVPSYYVHNTKLFKTQLGTEDNSRDFTIQGNFFTQQNDLTSVCAHAALRMVINSSPKIQSLLRRRKVYKLTNRYINDTLGLDFSEPKKNIGHYDNDKPDEKKKEGLTAKDIESIAKSLGLRLHVSNFVEDSSVEYDELLYPIIESHYPSILEVRGWDSIRHEHYAHGVGVMGHTLNSDRWQPEATIGYGNYPIRKYIPACSWVCHYIISDDNYGMNVTLPSDMIRNDRVPYKNPNLHATRVLSMFPKKVNVMGYRAQKIAMDIASKLIQGTTLKNKTEYWLQKLKEKSKNLVCRTILIKGKDYHSYIEKLIKTNFLNPTDEQLQYFRSLPTYVWITEVTIPNLYTGNKDKLADVIIDAGAKQKDVKNYDCFILAWFPGFIRYRFHKEYEYWYVKGHVPLIRTGDKPFFEW